MVNMEKVKVRSNDYYEIDNERNYNFGDIMPSRKSKY